MIFDDVLDLAKKVSKYTIAGEGNVSIRDGDTMLIKASGSTLETMTDEDLVRCNLDGNALEDEKKKPSMEVSFHAWILKSFPEIKCVCHTHPTNTNKILCSGDIIDFANKNKLKISMLVISNESKFLKKAKGLIRFECDQVNTLKKTLSSLSKNKTIDKIKLKSTGYDESGDVVSEFIYEWSFKLKE